MISDNEKQVAHLIDGRWQLIDDFAVANNYSRWYSMKLCRDKKLPASKMNGKWYVDLQVLSQMLSDRMNQGIS